MDVLDGIAQIYSKRVKLEKEMDELWSVACNRPEWETPQILYHLEQLFNIFTKQLEVLRLHSDNMTSIKKKGEDGGGTQCSKVERECIANRPGYYHYRYRGPGYYGEKICYTTRDGDREEYSSTRSNPPREKDDFNRRTPRCAKDNERPSHSRDVKRPKAETSAYDDGNWTSWQ